MAECLSAHGIGGYNLLTQLLRPFPELRGFYFGVRSEIYRMCEPKEDSTTAYIHLKEIQTKRDAHSLLIFYKPLKPVRLAEARYTADLRNSLLAPLVSPRKDGINALIGLFSKNEFCPAILTFQILVDFLTKMKVPAGQFPLACKEGKMLVLTVKNTPHRDTQSVAFQIDTIENDRKIPLELIIFNVKSFD